VLNVSIRRLGPMMLSGKVNRKSCCLFLVIFSWYKSFVSSLDATVEPWIEGLWNVLKETLTRSSSSLDDVKETLSESFQQVTLVSNTTPVFEQHSLLTNKFKSNDDNLTYSSALAERAQLTLPPKPIHSLVVNLFESFEVCSSFDYNVRISSLNILQGIECRYKFVRSSIDINWPNIFNT
jgi:hypothetical protein